MKVTGTSGAQLWGSVARARGSPSRRVRVANISWLCRRMLLLCQLSSVPYIGLQKGWTSPAPTSLFRCWAVCSGMGQQQVEEIQLAKSWVSPAQKEETCPPCPNLIFPQCRLLFSETAINFVGVWQSAQQLQVCLETLGTLRAAGHGIAPQGKGTLMEMAGWQLRELWATLTWWHTRLRCALVGAGAMGGSMGGFLARRQETHRCSGL